MFVNLQDVHQLEIVQEFKMFVNFKKFMNSVFCCKFGKYVQELEKFMWIQKVLAWKNVCEFEKHHRIKISSWIFKKIALKKCLWIQKICMNF